MVWTGLFIGLAGSLHCIGMCGPIALALPGKFSTNWAHLSGRLLYHLGRIITYTLLGLVAGLAGQGVGLAGAGLQQGLSVSLGLLLLIVTLFTAQKGGLVFRWPLLERGLGWVKKSLSRQLARREHPSLLAIGLLNGLLPCGFVYLGLAGALALGNAGDSALFMALFGVGTTPLMLSLSLFGGLLKEKLRSYTQPVMTGFAIVFSLLLILRGLNLGIPYLSPGASPAMETLECH